MALWEPTKCCCFQLRTGSLIIGFLFLIGGCFSLFGGIRTFVVGQDSVTDICEQEDDMPLEECIEFYWKIELGATCTSMVMAVFHIIFSILLLYGIYKKKTAFFVPLMIVYLIQICLLILITLVLIGLFLFIGFPFAALVIFAAIMGLLIFLETYFLLVIRAHYYEIKRAKGQVHLALKDEPVEAPAYPYPGMQASPPPYSAAAEQPGYPGSDAPLYPDIEKVPK